MLRLQLLALTAGPVHGQGWSRSFDTALGGSVLADLRRWADLHVAVSITPAPFTNAELAATLSALNGRTFDPENVRKAAAEMVTVHGRRVQGRGRPTVLYVPRAAA